MNNSSIAIIPARLGSIRLPNKNIQLLGNIPLIAHSILYAKENDIDKIIISSDDERIIEIAEKYDVDFQLRPNHLATDISPTIDTLEHIITTIDEEFENVILLQPTNPLRPKNMLKEALNIFNQDAYDSLMTVTRNHQKFGKINKNQFIPFNYKMGQRSQDLEPLYYENGLLYITKSKLIKKGKILGKNNYPLIVNHPFSQIDIDTQEDFDLAEFYYNKHKNE